VNRNAAEVGAAYGCASEFLRCQSPGIGIEADQIGARADADLTPGRGAQVGEALNGHGAGIGVEGPLDIDDLFRDPPVVRLPGLVLSARADRQPFDRGTRATGPVRSEGQLSARSDDARHPILIRGPSFAEAGDREHGHEYVELSPQGLHVRDDAEFGEAVEVLGGDELSLRDDGATDRKSTRLNSSHVSISYAVFCLKKEKTKSARARAAI